MLGFPVGRGGDRRCGTRVPLLFPLRCSLCECRRFAELRKSTICANIQKGTSPGLRR